MSALLKPRLTRSEKLAVKRTMQQGLRIVRHLPERQESFLRTWRTAVQRMVWELDYARRDCRIDRLIARLRFKTGKGKRR